MSTSLAKSCASCPAARVTSSGVKARSSARTTSRTRLSLRSRAPSTYSRPSRAVLSTLQAADGGFRDHAAVGDDADAADAEASSQAVDHRQQHADIGGVAGPHLRADRSPLGVHHQAEDHLHQIRAVVLGIAALAERLPALAGEGEGRGVHEDDGELAEQVTSAFEQRLLDLVLDAARGKGGGVLLPTVLGVEFLAEPGHGAVEVVKVEVVSAGDVVVGHPLLAGTIGAGDHQAV